MTPFLVYSTKSGRKWITIQEVLKKSILNKWRNEILLPLPLVIIPFGTSTKHKKRWPCFLWPVFHKAVAVNEWHGQISVEIDKSCPQRSSQSLELVEHRFFNCLLAQQMRLTSFCQPLVLKNHFNDAMPL